MFQVVKVTFHTDSKDTNEELVGKPERKKSVANARAHRLNDKLTFKSNDGDNTIVSYIVR